MVKILSQAGTSLADIYEVVGSVAGIEQLETRELGIVHEMGATVFSERVDFFLGRIITGPIAQNVDFDLSVTEVPNTPTRLLGLALLADAGVRILNAAVFLRQTPTREMPVWAYDGSNFLDVRWSDEGSIGNFDLLLGSPAVAMIPSFTGGSTQRRSVDEIILHGRTTGFGAGTVSLTGLFYLAAATDPTNISYGLPIPSW